MYVFRNLDILLTMVVKSDVVCYVFHHSSKEYNYVEGRLCFFMDLTGDDK